LQNRGSGLYRLLVTKPMIEIGKLSYSLYLWQELFLAPDDGHRIVRLAARVVLLAVVAVISYRAIERPFLGWRNRLLEPVLHC
jgi:peptidoglycan/LPS O-acetylase OafA/YrhL